MTKPIIGISGNEFLNATDDTEPLLSYAATSFVRAIETAGGIPLILPIVSPDLVQSYIRMIDKLILTGGQNVLPHYYGQEKTIESENYHPNRDRFEMALIEEAIKQQKPILGICRGMQLFNVAMGGSLHQEIPNHWQTSAANSPSHPIHLQPDTPLSTIYGEKPMVNSFHRQAIDQLATPLQVIGQSEDQIIEAVIMTEQTPFLGVQWHPEMLYENQVASQSLFNYFVQNF
ncbi:gamma-glutamyl-gamma-aminobutyrate hydrolase family protein [Streptococcus sp. zg-86]|uniref:Gamma-glutamyl-gamma-aminobutyrate hydrolase family protein n=1 Tax=Streptococcus zhangguiae TaxID=2664091 RepID=A0A6I4RDS6_9STRE|nr:MULTISPECIES: gamma-glutamyl-gamma-aminobutyrate hydrolase family protein [unclassified Streptococcus]MTB63972.1 gamma-glutamyl-gamma-aminobutyrate hydrolase family protein [Streptococcus sp. zg-86]MTB90282.1 gamma-glutamyl-gamma-aminobutyrate hydrolase family protein [Streptococcus sp. zg-36]MWV55960.1 gamma-glutamyl-gamma-aminobutyrate hydrolase family protein [Streptococcus sp. zg-70]QTH46999.1 gamma-glutamyl-gamma-aminobutyrate hydrolase family protein [Streptococcus sp. zg-86]